MRVAVLVAAFAMAGCAGTVFDTSGPELRRSLAALAQEKAALVRQYRECLKLAETNRGADCSGYAVALEAVGED